MYLPIKSMIFCLIFFIKAYVVGTHLNCIDKLMQFKWVPTTYAFTEVDKKYTDCNLKNTQLLACALIEVCEVIRLNTFFFLFPHKLYVVGTHWNCLGKDIQMSTHNMFSWKMRKIIIWVLLFSRDIAVLKHHHLVKRQASTRSHLVSYSTTRFICFKHWVKLLLQ